MKRDNGKLTFSITDVKIKLDVTIMQLNHKSRLQLVMIQLYLLKVLAKNI